MSQANDDRVLLYDTTLRDGCQAERVALSIQDKLRIAHRLDDLGIGYIEGGWPNETNPRDIEFFRQARDHDWSNARIAAFGSTRRRGVDPEDDRTLNQLVESGAPVITIFGKSWHMHAEDILRVSLEENLEMIEDSVAFLKENAPEVIFDAEHFFDGYKARPDYAKATLEMAIRGGADSICLCDTNGGSMPWEIEEICAQVISEVDVLVGIHCHNDGGTAVANTLAAVRAGCRRVQGTINGYGERAGNANLCVIIPNLQLKMNMHCISDEQMRQLKPVSKLTSELANLPHDHRQPYVGDSAFAHKGGMHVNAVMKRADSFEHVPPEAVGNERRILVSDVSGSTTVAKKLQNVWPDVDRKDPIVRRVLQRMKEKENLGYEFEAAEASLMLLAQELRGEREKLFTLHGFRVISGKHEEGSEPFAEATVEIDIGDEHFHTAGKGTGPVHALDLALRKALRDQYPEVERLELVDYKVRVLEGSSGTASGVRVIIQTSDGSDVWGTVGVDENIIEASWQALVDSIEYGLYRARNNK